MCIVVGHLAFLSTKLSADHPGVSSATVSSDMSEAKFSGLTLGRTTAARTQHHVLKWGCLACFKHLEVSESVCVFYHSLRATNFNYRESRRSFSHSRDVPVGSGR